MKGSNIIDFLKKNSDEYTSSHIELINYELGCTTSHFGENFASPIEGKKINKLKDNVLRDYLEFLVTKFLKKNIKL